MRMWSTAYFNILMNSSSQTASPVPPASFYIASCFSQPMEWNFFSHIWLNVKITKKGLFYREKYFPRSNVDDT